MWWSSVPALTTDRPQRIVPCAEGLLKSGQTLVLEEKVDPSIIGGVMIDIGDKHLDLSILSRVKKLQQIVREAV